jgi:hypothetical protein
MRIAQQIQSCENPTALKQPQRQIRTCEWLLANMKTFMATVEFLASLIPFLSRQR